MNFVAEDPLKKTSGTKNRQMVFSFSLGVMARQRHSVSLVSFPPMSQSWQNSLRDSEERILCTREEGEEEEEGDEGEEAGLVEDERGVFERGTSVGASSLSFSNSCFQKSVLSAED